MINPDKPAYRFSVAPMLDWTEYPINKGYTEVHAYWVRTDGIYPQFL